MKIKNKTNTISFLLLVFTVFYAFYSQTPKVQQGNTRATNEYSIDKALAHLDVIAHKPHFVGTKEHIKVRNYIVDELEKLGLEITIQEQEAVNLKWRAGAKIYNILARIKGTESENTLMLLTHYDSAPHSSLGASDAGSGVVSILESLRVYIASGKKPKNDIIILISDAEELGLLGAKAFVKHHPWAKDVALILNLEARGSGGPSYMLLETNTGNHQFIKEFNKAKTTHPVGNSLMYSIYKMLPNDTDLTVFREYANIDGFNFAFIDDHFDYHTAQDTKERLDINTLAHQGSSTLSLLHYFSDSDLSNLKGQSDDVFFNFPLFGVVYYSFSAVIPVIILVSLVFLGFLIYGFRNKKISLKESLSSFVPFTILLGIALGIGYFGWKFILFLHPQYHDILHGFPYNGHLYLITFLALVLGIAFWLYQRYLQKIKLTNLLVAPLVFWIGINFVIAFKLKGGGFFIIPLIGMLVSWAILLVTTRKTNQKTLLFTLLAIPSLLLFSPFLTMFPVGLGLSAISVSLVLLALLFGSTLPVFGFYSNAKQVAKLFIGISLLAFISASFQSDYNEHRKLPNSIIYIQDMDKEEAFFTSYNKKNDSFTKQFLGKNPQQGDLSMIFSSKFKTKLNLYKKTTPKEIPAPVITKQVNDTLHSNSYVYDYVIKPQRAVNALYITAKDSLAFEQISFNGESFDKKNKDSKYVFTTGKNSKIIFYYLADGVDSLHIRMQLPKNFQPNFELYEISYDLLTNPLFTTKPRSDTMMPSPFVINDAVILKKSF